MKLFTRKRNSQIGKIIMIFALLYCVYKLDFYSDVFKRMILISFPVSIYEVPLAEKQLDKDTNKRFKILFWTDSYCGKGRDWFGLGSEPFKSCLYSNCFGITDRGQYDSSDAVLFEMAYTNRLTLPRYKLSTQKWILRNMEPPTLKDLHFDYYNGLFNATWTYFKQSEIITNPNYDIVKLKTPNKSLLGKNYAGNKTKLVAWFVSRCHTQSKREMYVEKLQRYINIDIFGHCGSELCTEKECDDLLAMDYKFYLSFESSMCTDYVTEKLWRPIIKNVIPIVLGSVNYTDILPPNSYINVNNFSTPHALAQYLLLLDQNDTLYNSYFKWKAMYRYIRKTWKRNILTGTCDLCRYLNKARNQVKVYHNLSDIWSEKNMCTKPEDFYSHLGGSIWHH